MVVNALPSESEIATGTTVYGLKKSKATMRASPALIGVVNATCFVAAFAVPNAAWTNAIAEDCRASPSSGDPVASNVGLNPTRPQPEPATIAAHHQRPMR